MIFLAIGESPLSDIGLGLAMLVAFIGCIGVARHVYRHRPTVDMPDEAAGTRESSPPKAA